MVEIDALNKLIQDLHKMTDKEFGKKKKKRGMSVTIIKMSPKKDLKERLKGLK